MSILPFPTPSHAFPRAASLPLLPSELLLQIFSHLDAGNSTCLGLTCKRLYLVHRSLHGSVRLETRVAAPLSTSLGPKLYELLEEWYLPGFEMCWCGHAGVKTARVECGAKAEEAKDVGRCAKCRIRVFSKPQLRVKMRWIYHLAT